MNAYEKERLANIKRNAELMREIGIEPIRTPSTPKSTPKKVIPRKKAKLVESFEYNTRRTSSRLSGTPAESESLKKERELEIEQRNEAERAKRRRKPGLIKLEEAIVNDAVFDTAKTLLTGACVKGEETDAAEVHDATVDITSSINALRLLDRWDPSRIKVTPERIFSIAFHPTSSKKLVMAGDKLGHLGMWDVESDQGESSVKNEAEEDEEVAEPEPLIHHYKLHARTITAIQCDLAFSNKVYTSSYDGTIRCLDLQTGVATEAYVSDTEACVTSLNVTSDGRTMYFATLDGDVGVQDLRSKSCDSYKLHDRKIGTLGVNPQNEKMVCTSSLDRTMKVWDFRKIVGPRAEKRPTLIAEYLCRLSVSSAYFNSNSSIIATSYDDTLKYFDLSTAESWDGGVATQIEPTYQLNHNNQTGRWITLFKAAWQRHPLDGQQKVVIGNMSRKIDVLSDTGEALTQLIDERITAVPAVVAMHDYHNWLVAGNASGKALFFS